MPSPEAGSQPTASRAKAKPAPEPEPAPQSKGRPETVDWEELYEQLSDVEKRREVRARQHKAEQAALAEYERWATDAVTRVMSDLKQAAESRAEELKARTGKVLEVEYPSGPAVVGAAGECEIRFLRLGLGRACVHVYSSRSRSSATHIHLLPAFADSLKKNHRLVSEPGAFVVRRADDSYELRPLRGGSYEAPSIEMSVDTLLYKALRLLARASDENLAL